MFLTIYLSYFEPEKFGQRVVVKCFPPPPVKTSRPSAVRGLCAWRGAESSSATYGPRSLGAGGFLHFFRHARQQFFRPTTIITQDLLKRNDRTPKNEQPEPRKNGGYEISVWERTYVQGLWLLVLWRRYMFWKGESSHHTRRPRRNLMFKGWCWCFLHIGFS